MIKRVIKETVKEYDESGKVIRETVTETTEDDDTVYFPQSTSYPYLLTQTPFSQQETKSVCVLD